MQVSSDLGRHAADLRLRLSRLNRRLRQETDRSALTMSQMAVLGRLDREGPATLSELAAGELVRPQSMARTLDALDALGMIRRAPHPTDRRQTLIAATPAAREVVAEDRQRRDAWLARAMAEALTDEERDLLIRAAPILERLADYR